MSLFEVFEYGHALCKGLIIYEEYGKFPHGVCATMGIAVLLPTIVKQVYGYGFIAQTFVGQCDADAPGTRRTKVGAERISHVLFLL